MQQFFQSSSLKWLAGAAIVFAAPLAGASDVDWSVTVGSNGYPAPRVYTPPPAVVYVQPQPVYVRPRPVYVQPATVVQYGPPAYYVQEGRPHRHKHNRHHWKHHQGHHYDY